jgi:hypothetical protein
MKNTAPQLLSLSTKRLRQNVPASLNQVKNEIKGALVGGLFCDLDIHLNGLVVLIIDLRDVHCERAEPSNALGFRPPRLSRRNLFQQLDKKRIKVKLYPSPVAAAIA